MKNGLTFAAAPVLLAERLRVPTELYVSSGAEEEEGTNRALTELTDHVPNLTLMSTEWLPHILPRARAASTWPRARSRNTS